MSYNVSSLKTTTETSDGTTHAKRVCDGQLSCQHCSGFTLWIEINTLATTADAAEDIRTKEADLNSLNREESNHEFESAVYNPSLDGAKVGDVFAFDYDGWDSLDNLRDDGTLPDFKDWMGFRGSRLVFNVGDQVVSLEARARSQIGFSPELGVEADLDASIPHDLLTGVAQGILDRWQASPRAS